MSLPSELTALVERLNQELDRIKIEATEGIKIANAILNRFPDNFVVIQWLAFLKMCRGERPFTPTERFIVSEMMVK